MSIAGLTPSEQIAPIEAVFAANDVRVLIANHLGVSVGRVTDEAHFTNDLGADWLDRLDLMIAVEAQFTGVEITDDVIDRIELVVFSWKETQGAARALGITLQSPASAKESRDWTASMTAALFQRRGRCLN